MKHHAKLAIIALSAAAATFLAMAKPASQSCESYSTLGHGPSLLLLHDSSTDDLAWIQAARRLASQFEVTLLDVSELVTDPKAVQRLRQTIKRLDLDAARISGSRAGSALALRYALSYPDQARSFTLPQSGEDLEILADLINSTPLTKS